MHPLLVPLDAIERGRQLDVGGTLRPFFPDINDHVKFAGQNFGWLVGHVGLLWQFLVFGLGSLTASVVLLWLFFKRRGYFGDADA